MFCEPKEINTWVLNCQLNVFHLLFNHAALCIVTFLFAHATKTFFIFWKKIKQKRIDEEAKEMKESLLSHKFHAPILNSTQRYRETQKVINPRQFFSEMKKLKMK
jgi:Na+/phosphate symporter